MTSDLSVNKLYFSDWQTFIMMAQTAFSVVIKSPCLFLKA